MTGEADEKKKVVIILRDGSSDKMKAKLIKALEEELGLEVEITDIFDKKMYPMEGAWGMDNANMENEICELSYKTVFGVPYKAMYDLSRVRNSMSSAAYSGGKRGHKHTAVFHIFAEQLQVMLSHMYKICKEEDGDGDGE